MSSTAEQWAAQASANATARAKKGVLPNGSVSILRRMLSKYWVGPGEQNNLVSYDGGRWYVPRDVMEGLYNKSMWWLSGKNGQQDPEPFGLIEQIAPAGKLFFDLDGRVELAEQGEIENEWRIGQVIERVVNRCFVRENKPLEVYISRSSVVPKHKMHFAIPSITLNTGVKAAITEMLREELKSAGMVRAAEAVDAKCLRGLRMRHTMKVDWKNGDFEWLYEKGRYPDWNIVYPEKGPPVKENRFRMCLIAWLDDGDTLTPTRDGLVVPELKPKYNDRLDACVFTYEHREEAAHIIAGLNVDECLKPKGWKGTVFVFDRVKPGPCPCGSVAVHDRRGAYAVICAQGDMIKLRCSFDSTGQCRSRVLWRRERDVDTPVEEDRWSSDKTEDDTWEPNRLTQLLTNSGWIVKGLEPDPQNCSEDAVELVASKEIECRCCEKMLAVGDRVFVTQNEDEYWGGCLDNDGTRVCTRAQMEATEIKSDSEDDDSSDYESEDEKAPGPVHVEPRRPPPVPTQPTAVRVDERVDERDRLRARIKELEKAVVVANRQGVDVVDMLREARMLNEQLTELGPKPRASRQKPKEDEEAPTPPNGGSDTDMPLRHPDIPFSMMPMTKREVRDRYKKNGWRGLAEIVVERTINSVRCDAGQFYMFRDDSMLWQETTKDIIGTFTINVLRGAWTDSALLNTLQDTKGVDAIKRILQPLYELRPECRRFGSTINLRDEEVDLFPIANNEVVNLKTGVVRARTYNDRFSFASPCTLLPADDPATQAHAYLNALTCEDAAQKLELLQLGRMLLSGDISAKVIVFMMGKPDSGRSLFTDLVKIIMGDFWTTMSSAVLLSNQNDSNADTHNASLVGIMRGQRAALLSEMKTGSAPIAIDKVSRHVGDQTLRCRAPHSAKTVEFANRTKLVLVANDVPDLARLSEGQMKNFMDKVWLFVFKALFQRDSVYKQTQLDNTYLHNQLFSLFVRTPPRQTAIGQHANNRVRMLRFSSDPVEKFVGDVLIEDSASETESNHIMDAWRMWSLVHSETTWKESVVRTRLNALLGDSRKSNSKTFKVGWKVDPDVMKELKLARAAMDAEEQEAAKNRAANGSSSPG